MRKDIIIPPELSHLPIDERGYPVPYFVSKVKGKWEFRYIDLKRIKHIIREELCHICGKPLKGSDVYFISGPQGFKNRVSSDAGMHEVCARFSLQACPHMYFEKAERRERDHFAKKVLQEAPIYQETEKPAVILLIKVIGWWPGVVAEDGKPIILYRPSGKPEEYIYQNNVLIKKE